MLTLNFYLTFFFAGLIIFFHHPDPTASLYYFLLGLGVSGTVVFFKAYLKE